MKKLLVDKDVDLKSFLAQKLKISKNKAKELIDSKTVFVNNRRIWIANHNLKKGDKVEVIDFSVPKWELKKSIIYEDEFILALQKPPFIETEGKKGSLEDILRKKINSKIKAIHRLDKETSGVVLFAKDTKVFEKFKKLWENKQVKKHYLAISINEAPFKKKVINIPVEKKYAKSILTVKKAKNGFTLFEVEIKTGRKHQIRIHLSKTGFPIVGDKIYGIKKTDSYLLKNVKRQLLHAYRISFFHPFLKKKVQITAKPYPDFESFGKSVKLL